mmetsp:Transcript_71651/g.207510  ORF Transcript_71651/g.207510 Transcript_71651/m.207510 type:complete len:320 (-) Transcript_71651:974-1933(-)
MRCPRRQSIPKSAAQLMQPMVKWKYIAPESEVPAPPASVARFNVTGGNAMTPAHRNQASNRHDQPVFKGAMPVAAKSMSGIRTPRFETAEEPSNITLLARSLCSFSMRSVVIVIGLLRTPSLTSVIWRGRRARAMPCRDFAQAADALLSMLLVRDWHRCPSPSPQWLLDPSLLELLSLNSCPLLSGSSLSWPETSDASGAASPLDNCAIIVRKAAAVDVREFCPSAASALLVASPTDGFGITCNSLWLVCCADEIPFRNIPRKDSHGLLLPLPKEVLSGNLWVSPHRSKMLSVNISSRLLKPTADRFAANAPRPAVATE